MTSLANSCGERAIYANHAALAITQIGDVLATDGIMSRLQRQRKIFVMALSYFSDLILIFFIRYCFYYIFFPTRIAVSWLDLRRSII